MDADQYGAFAGDYDWFFDDIAMKLGSDVPGVRASLADLPAGASVLDAACGIGIDAAALAVRGFDVTASDASGSMLERARVRFDATPGASNVETHQCPWVDLPERFGPDRFDVVLCTGGSIAHAAHEGDMVAAFEAFHAVLAPDGRLVLDSADWEVIHTEGSRMLVEPRVVARNGLRCVRSYAWHLPEGFGEPCVFEAAVILLDGDRARLRSHAITLHPFTRADLNRRLGAAGFGRIALDLIPGDDRYTAIAHKPSGS